MKTDTRRSVNEGIGFGLIAGLVFGVMGVIWTALAGGPPLMPLRMSASILLGSEALSQASLGTAVILGLIVHFVLAAAFGLIYGLINTAWRIQERTRFGIQSWFGLVFGVALWLVNFQIIARIGYPWFLGTNQWAQIVLHGVFYGLPLGLMYAAAERRTHSRPVEYHA